MEKYNILKEGPEHPDFGVNFEEFLNRGERIGEGGNAEVFTRDNDPDLKNIGYKKIKPSPQILWNDLEKEFDAQEKIYENGVRAPRPYLVFRNKISREEYFLMERIPGHTLAELIGKNIKLPENFDIDLFMGKINTELQKMHKAGIFHRDLHTKNIMITPEGDPVIIDFGTAYVSLPGDEEVDSIYEEAVMYRNHKGEYENKSGYFMKDSEALSGVEDSLKSYVNRVNGYIAMDKFGQPIDK